VSSRTEVFECHWQPSRRLLVLYLLLLIAALAVLWLAALPLWASLCGSLLCILHAARTLPRHVLLTDAQAISGVRHDALGWQLFSSATGWQPVELRRDSLALPQAVVLRYRSGGEWRVRGLCIPSDALEAQQHRRLRVRLKFSRQRWQMQDPE
jgi:toxin CptA